MDRGFFFFLDCLAGRGDVARAHNLYLSSRYVRPADGDYATLLTAEQYDMAWRSQWRRGNAHTYTMLYHHLVV